MCKGVAVMRRRADSWLNATQILNAAGFSTRVLEREVQKGEPKRVQGGYEKYQSGSLRNCLSPRLSCPDTSSPSHWPIASRHLDFSRERTAACQAVQL